MAENHSPVDPIVILPGCDLCKKEAISTFRDSVACPVCNFNVCDSCHDSIMHALIHEQGLRKEP